MAPPLTGFRTKYDLELQKKLCPGCCRPRRRRGQCKNNHRCPTCVGPSSIIRQENNDVLPSACIAQNRHGKLHVQQNTKNMHHTCISEKQKFYLPAGTGNYCVREVGQGGVFECIRGSGFTHKGKEYCAWQQPHPKCATKQKGCYQRKGRKLVSAPAPEGQVPWTQYNCSDTNRLEGGVWCPKNPCNKYTNWKGCLETSQKDLGQVWHHGRRVGIPYCEWEQN